MILSGGGTGGHIYPAVAVAQALQRRLGDGVELLFVGAEGKMEMQKVPALGYRIVGLPVAGLQRRLTLRNLAVPFKLWRSLCRASRLIREFRPDVVAGFGGYASGPVLKKAQSAGVPTVLWEGNSYAGMANRLLARRAKAICVAYGGMERFFPAGKLVPTGNPLRGSFGVLTKKDPGALAHFGFRGDRPVLLVTGGSLGTRTLNESVLAHLDRILERREVDLIWQTGAYYFREIEERMRGREADNIWFGPFIDRMDCAYAAADLTVSRAGACTVSELALVGMPAIFVPSPNVAEDHQTKNARALAERGAALMIADAEAREKAIPLALDTIARPELLENISLGIKAFAVADSADRMADILLAAAGAGEKP